MLKNSETREVRILRERMIILKSPPPTLLMGAESPSGGQRQILADPSAQNLYRVCAGNFLLEFTQIRSFSTISARVLHRFFSLRALAAWALLREQKI